MNEIDRAVALLRAGDIVGFPTETVYGLGADATNPQAVARIFQAKGRPVDHPLIVHLPADDHLERWARDIPAIAWDLIEQFWPGPLTLILKRQPNVPDAVTGGQDTVGVRVPGHPMALDLLRAFGGGLAAPSANRFGCISPTTEAHVREELGDLVPLVLDGGPCQVGIESTIVDLSRGRPVVLRPGFIGDDALALVLGQSLASGSHDATLFGAPAPTVSGSLAAHYAPATPLEIVVADQLLGRVDSLLREGRVPVVLAHSVAPMAGVDWRFASGVAPQYGHDLYANLRALDAASADAILLEAPPEGIAWEAIWDRLRRAARGRSEA